MSFNKRFFNTEMLVHSYNIDPVKGIKNVIGKTEGFIFGDELSAQVVSLWLDGKELEANEIMKEYVSRISNEAGNSNK